MTTEATPETLSVDEAIARYPNEWVFMQVTETDGLDAPVRGVLLAHHPKRGILQRSIMKAIAKRGEEQTRYYVFQSFPRYEEFPPSPTSASCGSSTRSCCASSPTDGKRLGIDPGPCARLDHGAGLDLRHLARAFPARYLHSRVVSEQTDGDDARPQLPPPLRERSLRRGRAAAHAHPAVAQRLRPPGMFTQALISCAGITGSAVQT